jgi:mono/diheme cytochrome c family protein
VAAQDAAKGEQIYASQKCSMCHLVGGNGNKLSPLDGVDKKLTADQIREVDRHARRGRQEGKLHEEAGDAEDLRQAPARLLQDPERDSRPRR